MKSNEIEEQIITLLGTTTRRRTINRVKRITKCSFKDVREVMETFLPSRPPDLPRQIIRLSKDDINSIHQEVKNFKKEIEMSTKEHAQLVLKLKFNLSEGKEKPLPNMNKRSVLYTLLFNSMSVNDPRRKLALSAISIMERKGCIVMNEKSIYSAFSLVSNGPFSGRGSKARNFFFWNKISIEYGL